MTAQLLASRVMKARRESICVLCQRLIKPGDLIAKTGAWVHARCAIDRNRDHPAPGGAEQEGTT